MESVSTVSAMVVLPEPEPPAMPMVSGCSPEKPKAGSLTGTTLGGSKILLPCSVESIPMSPDSDQEPSVPDPGFAGFLHRDTKERGPGEAFTPPITMASVFALPAGIEADHQYGRWSNPTWSALEAALEVSERAPTVAFPSGMAATASVFYALLRAGDRVLIPADAYYTTRVFAERYLGPFGVQVETVPTLDLAETRPGGLQAGVGRDPVQSSPRSGRHRKHCRPARPTPERSWSPTTRR